jgi:hypothetical protein
MDQAVMNRRETRLAVTMRGNALILHAVAHPHLESVITSAGEAFDDAGTRSVVACRNVDVYCQGLQFELHV